MAGVAIVAIGIAWGCWGAALAHEDATPVLDFEQAPADVLPWGQLAKVGVRRAGQGLDVKFLPPVLALEGKQATLYGFMTTITRSAEHERFLLSKQPLICAHCELTGQGWITGRDLPARRRAGRAPAGPRALKACPEGAAGPLANGRRPAAMRSNARRPTIPACLGMLDRPTRPGTRHNTSHTTLMNPTL
jgi:hypothetical protein